MNSNIRDELPTVEHEGVEVCILGTVINESITNIAVGFIDNSREVKDTFNCILEVYDENAEVDEEQANNVNERQSVGLDFTRSFSDLATYETEVSEGEKVVLKIRRQVFAEFTYEELTEVEVDPVVFTTNEFLVGLVYR